jgi:hypothetical protein
VGANIQKGMAVPEGAPKSVVEMTFIYNINGVDTEFSTDDLMNLPDGATFVDRKDKVITEGYVPPIHDFTMMKDGSDYKDEFLAAPKLLLFVAYDLTIAEEGGMEKLEKLSQEAKAKGYIVIGMTNSAVEEIEKAQNKYDLTFDFYTCDAITLKTIERANPSIVVLQEGTIKQKVHHNDIDDLKL